MKIMLVDVIEVLDSVLLRSKVETCWSGCRHKISWGSKATRGGTLDFFTLCAKISNTGPDVGGGENSPF